MSDLPELTPFELEGSPFPVVNPTVLPDNINLALDEFMQGKTASHPTYIYIQDWQEFCAAVEHGYITIKQHGSS